MLQILTISFTLLLGAILAGGRFESCRVGEIPEIRLSQGPEEKSPPNPDAVSGTPATGVWGGEHIRMEIGTTLSRLEWDCAHGSIAKPITPDDQGKFAAEGVYVRERPGPIRVGFEAPAVRASYTGAVTASEMTLEVVLAESREKIGTFRLKLGEEGRLRKCR